MFPYFLKFETEINLIARLSQKKCGDYLHVLWAIPEKIQRMRPWNFQGIEEQMGIPGIK